MEKSATNGQPDAVTQTFGPIEGTSMPELALPDPEKVTETPETPPQDESAAAPDQEPTAPQETIDDPPAAPDEGTPKAASGDEPASPPSTKEIPPEKLAGILQKYQSKPESMAKALLSLRRKQTETAEERNDATKRLEQAVNVLEEHFDEVDGEFRLKPSVAAKTLGSQQGKTPFDGLPKIPDEAAVTAEIAQSYLQKFKAQGVEDTEAEALVGTLKTEIASQAKERVQSKRTELQAVQIEQHRRVFEVAQAHLQKHPEDKELLPAMDDFYGNFPESVRARAIAEGWVDFSKQTRLLRLEQSLPKMIQETWDAAIEHANSNEVPDTGSAPQGGENAPAKTQVELSPEDKIKQGILRASGLPSFEELIGQ